MRSLVFFLLLTSIPSFSQTDDGGIEAVKKFQKDLNAEYKSKKDSPLDPEARKHFKQHDFFEINLKYRVPATLRITEPAPFFKMKTSSLALPEYRVYGILEFAINEQKFALPVYQSKQLMATEKYRDYLFLPFTDLTNGNQTYSGGRYIELSIPTGTSLVVDFNQAYNPYCAYSKRYSCPVVPAENHLDIEIPAGVMYAAKK